jgi:hypothetical protein
MAMQPRLVVFLIGAAMVCGCATPGEQAGARYFLDASRCVKRAAHNQPIQVPTGRTMTRMDIAMSYDATHFSDCMVRAGHPSPRVEPESYLVESRKCLELAPAATLPEDAYAACIDRSGIDVDVEFQDIRTRK